MAVIAVAALTGCSSAEDVGHVAMEVAPPGSGAELLSNTVPTAMAPGERRTVMVTMRNTGAVAGTNDWTTSSYRLMSIGTFFGWPHKFVSTNVPVGSTHTFSFVIQAPTTAGVYTFRARMYAPTGTFGDELTVSINVSAATTPEYACAFESGASSIPTMLAAGEAATAVVTVRNVGTRTWPSSGFGLSSQDSPANLWNQTYTRLATTVAPGTTATFNLPIRAPATTGTYSLRRQMLDSTSGGVGFFSSVPCVNASITVGGAPALDAALVSQNFPLVMAPSEIRTVSVTMENTGSETWLADGTYVLNALDAIWGVTLVSVPTLTTTGGTSTLSFTIRAPAAPGTYTHRWRLRKLSGANAGFFGPLISVGMTVDAGATPLLDAAVVAQTIPGRITAGRTAAFTIEMENTGTGTWSGTGFSLRSVNSPSNIWTTTTTPLGAAESVAPGGTRVFTFNVVAPPTPGTYDSRWQMRETALFGDVAITSGIIVTLCGNNVIDPGETCDDGNLINNDSCSDTCVFEQRLVDLAVDSADRTFIGSGDGRQLAHTAVGDVTGDGIPDLLTSELHSPAGVTPFRSGAGAIYAVSGGAGFFGGTTSIPTGTVFQISGAEIGDNLGQVASGVLGVGDVTGDGVSDVVVAAPSADGVGNARLDAGEVYVLAGGAALAAGGLIDLASDPASSLLTATLIGPNAGGKIQVLAVADVTGDGTPDIVLGAPVDDAAGTDAGAVYIVEGGPGLTGTVDLAAPGAVAVHTVLGATAGDRLGSSAAVGDFGGSSDNDLLLGAPFAAPGGRPRTGSVFAVFGPINSSSGAAAADARWNGRNDYEYLGIAIAVGNIGGAARADVLLGANQLQRSPGVVAGGLHIFYDGVMPGLYDLSSISADTEVRGVDQFDDMGTSIALGDTNADGLLEILVSASTGDGPTNSRSSAGECHLLRGRSTWPAVVDLATPFSMAIIYGAAANDLMARHQGSTVLTDLDGDGRADYCIGSYRGGTGALSVPGRIDCFLSP